MAEAFVVFRYAVLAVAGLLTLAAFGAMAVQRRTINPFSRLARAIRGATDPMLKPLEKRMIRAGRNPQSAPYWLIGIALVGGIVVISLAQWLVGQLFTLQAAGRMGGGTLGLVLLNWAFSLLMLAIVVRVIGSWFGAGRYNALLTPFYWLTDWLIEPLRRFVPTFGPIDITPLVAWFLLMVVRAILFRVI